MKSKSNTVTTQSGLAKAIGVSRQLVSFHVKNGKAPKDLNVEAWRTYLAAVGREGSASGELHKAIGKQKLLILKEVRHAKQRENRIKDGEAFDAGRVQRFITDVIHNVFYGELDRMALEFPVTLAGRTAIEIHEEILKQTETTKRCLRDRLAQLEAMGPKEKGKE